MKRKPQGTTTYPKMARVLSNNVFALRSLRREAIQSWCGGAGDEGGGAHGEVLPGRWVLVMPSPSIRWKPEMQPGSTSLAPDV